MKFWRMTRNLFEAYKSGRYRPYNKIKKTRKDKETYHEWVRRLLPELTEKQHKLICDMIKEVWFDGILFERKMSK